MMGFKDGGNPRNRKGFQIWIKQGNITPLPETSRRNRRDLPQLDKENLPTTAPPSKKTPKTNTPQLTSYLKVRI